MFLLITPVSGNLITHEAQSRLLVSIMDKFLYVYTDHDGTVIYPLDAIQSWQGYPSRNAALVDGADMRAYPGLE
jgi:hypothetical protein